MSKGHEQKNLQNLGTRLKLSDPTPPNTTLGTQKFRNILLFEDSPSLLDEFGNTDFGISPCFDSQGHKLWG